jgi:hypothetical protein
VLVRRPVASEKFVSYATSWYPATSRGVPETTAIAQMASALFLHALSNRDLREIAFLAAAFKAEPCAAVDDVNERTSHAAASGNAW